MGNYDQMAAAVSELSGGKNVVLLDDIGMPSIYVRIPKGKNSELVSGLSDNVHYAFNVDSVEKTAFYYSKYQNIIVKGIFSWTQRSCKFHKLGCCKKGLRK